MGSLGIVVALIDCPSSDPSSWKPRALPCRQAPQHPLTPLPFLPYPYSSSPWRTPLPFSPSLSETLTPMALGPWPSHRSQVRRPTWGCVQKGDSYRLLVSVSLLLLGLLSGLPHPLPSDTELWGSLSANPHGLGSPGPGCLGGDNGEDLLWVLCTVLEDVGTVWLLRDFSKHEGPCDKTHSHGARPGGPHD